jgi:acetyl esterase/lipase
MVLFINRPVIILSLSLKRPFILRNIFTAFFVSFLAFSGIAKTTEAGQYQLVSNILYRDSATADSYVLERCRLDLYYPKAVKKYKTVVWFHGGGLTSGNKFIPEQLQDQGFAVVAVNYRLYPKVKSPVYIDDAAAAVAWVFNNIDDFGGDNTRIFVSGHSAGGYLTSMIGLDKSYLKNYDIDADSIAALIPFSGHAITHFTVRAERGIDGTQVVVDKLAPIHHIRKDAPPVILITGDREMEMLGRYEENAYMYRMMKVIGHENTSLYELDGFNHGEMANPAFYILRDYVKEH